MKNNKIKDILKHDKIPLKFLKHDKNIRSKKKYNCEKIFYLKGDGAHK